ncbi:cytochrome c-type biogenesis protein [Thiopseudomonas denitrificans]|uniref:Cytochrome c-type biogenesis protein n=1 Tax=Thiopseudomonas denitrificans TaxID=1501432 RepID=A0A4R6U3V4_9GAMM|nr:cytochrome c-type biogenesis protein [Thiopseudomonas denitrificans]TDQ40122.1 cytochrome c-type biogenesis protein CcmH [Thiopseudomonas denitrificans]
MKKALLTLVCGLWLAAPALAAIDTHEFDTQAERDRYRKLTEELRCPKCQNQNIADSDAPISLDLREETYRLMTEEGLSDDQIVEFLVERYGDFVRYKPPVDKRTLVLWYGPFTLLGLGMLMLALIIVRRRKGGDSDAAGQQLSGDEQQRLNELLNQTRESADK